ncbi:DNA helicase-2 / ATP-dependent DNA helicase PcrA [Hathewaya proteolytica DSM 3090]|uniref:DNA helicase-2 / ATP-dependent DNA helicase PcrA n=1 Tax=Hathewaya proteolytica DSM 3090 TaxID=1121331 RepID=A0A1M6RTK9_9CLOT|nr:UvrD-helicase domain-containing protein [Hathewaya proteolytica]SHK35708.1 DNA helicase-2 / ATP-dependent DNA helicase PcrA [Hathewaya proteolytica DSM 3090]
MESKNIDISKEMELQLEKEKLDQVLCIIDEEIEKTIESRKVFLDELLTYRKQFVEEYRDDEDKVIEYFDHERFITEEAFNLMDGKLKELTYLKECPYFGRIDFREEEFGIEKIYIGRFGLLRKSDNEPVVVDWRSPVASLFYQGKLGEACYNVDNNSFYVTILKRVQFIIKKAKLLGMFDSDIDVKDEILQQVLSSNCQDKLKDIVRTIQKEQDNIIRTNPYDTVIVDGVAGSGKTTIALHRIAYLLYNYRKQLENKMLIIGPNEIFMEYISDVLPSLGEKNVEQCTFRELSLDSLGLKDEEVMSFNEYMEAILRKDKEIIEDMRLKATEEYALKLEDYVKKLEENYCVCRDVEYLGDIVVSEDDLKDMFYNYYIKMPLAKRLNKVRRIIISKLHYRRDEEVRKIKQQYNEIKKKLSESALEEEINNLQYKKKLSIRNVIEQLREVKKQLIKYQVDGIVDLYNKFNDFKQITNHDLAPMLYLKYKLYGFDIGKEIKHVVIDEAQDFSMLQLKVIKAMTNASAMTILGDSNQKIMPESCGVNMSQIKDIYDFKSMKFYKLDKSYRSTTEIMQYANKFLDNNHIIPLVRSGKPVEEKNICDLNSLCQLVTDKILRARDEEYNTVGVICEDMEQTEYVYKAIKDKVRVNIINKEESMYKGGVVVIPTYFAKGLEFDKVIAVFKHKYEDNNYMRYITCTRALHELCVINIK